MRTSRPEPHVDFRVAQTLHISPHGAKLELGGGEIKGVPIISDWVQLGRDCSYFHQIHKQETIRQNKAESVEGEFIEVRRVHLSTSPFTLDSVYALLRENDLG